MVMVNGRHVRRRIRVSYPSCIIHSYRLRCVRQYPRIDVWRIARYAGMFWPMGARIHGSIFWVKVNTEVMSLLAGRHAVMVPLVTAMVVVVSFRMRPMLFVK